MTPSTDARREYLRRLNERFDANLRQEDHRGLVEVTALVAGLFGDASTDLEEPVPELAELFDQTAFVLGSMEEYPEAEAFYRRALAIRRAVFGEDHPSVAVSLENLAGVCQATARDTEAEAHTQSAKCIFRREIDRLNEQLADRVARGLYGEAIPIAEQACGLLSRTDGEQGDAYAAGLTNLAYLYKQVAVEYEQPQYYARAEELYRRAIPIWLAAVGERHPDYATALNNLAMLCQAKGDLDEAESLLNQALELWRALHGSDHQVVAQALNNLALVAEARDDLPRAEHLHLEALEIVRHTVGETHHLFAQLLNNLGVVCRKRRKYLEAETYLRRALQLNRAGWPEGHPNTLKTVGNLVDLYRDKGDRAAEDRVLEETVRSLEAAARDRPYPVHPIPELVLAFRPMAPVSSPEAVGEQERADAPGPGSPPEDFQEALKECVRKFIEQDYAGCFRRVIELNAAYPTHEGLQLFLISVQRLDGPYRGGEAERLHPFATGLLHLTAGQPWWHSLVRLTLGLASRDEVLSRARDELQRSQAHYYAGARWLTEGRVEEARSAFEACLECAVDGFERRLAVQTRHAAAPAPGAEARSRLMHLHNQIHELRVQGRLHAALEVARQAHELALQQFPEGSTEVRLSLYDLALITAKTKDYVAAEAHFRNLLGSYRADPGVPPHHLAACLNGLGLTCLELGHHAEAESVLRESVDLMERAGLRQDPGYAHTLGNLAELHRERRDFSAALPLYERALAVLHAAGAEDDPEYGRWLTNSAVLYLDAGHVEQARDRLEKGLAIRKAALPPTHPDIADTLNVLALAEFAGGRPECATSLLREALEIQREALGEDHPRTATTLSNLASHFLHTGQLADGESLLRRAIDILRGRPGAKDLSLARLLDNLAIFCAVAGRRDEALSLWEESDSLAASPVSKILAASSERQRLALVGQHHRKYWAFLSVVGQLGYPADYAERAYNVVLRRKMLVAEIGARHRDEVLGGRHPELRPKLRALALLRQNIARKMLTGPGPEGADSHQAILQQWDEDRGRLETELGRLIPEIATLRALQTANAQSIIGYVPPGTALVEFVRFEAIDFSIRPDTRKWPEPQARYLAFVALADGPAPIQMIDLGPAAEIEQLLASFRFSITLQKDAATPTGGGGPGKPARVMSAGEDLRAILFDKVRPALGDRGRLIISPDGDLNRLPFEVLPTAGGRRLIDDYQMSYLGSGRDLLRLGQLAAEPGTRPLVVADPDFDLDGHVPARGPSSEQVTGPVSRDLDRRGHFARLPGTRVEGEAVARRLDAQLLTAEAAVESRLRAVASPRILHIATHGFFLPDQPWEVTKGLTDAATVAPPLPGGVAFLTSRLENPLLRSGLALTGVNRWLRRQPTPPEVEDGLLTAEDVSGLDLVGTELVVLSACETGLGDVQVGEGVFGLRRAFTMAGAKTLIMSLWRVPSEQTKELMLEFYERLEAGTPRAEALRQAQLSMKSRIGSPFFWGAFICQGDPAPVPLRTH
jgi:CHAT domain-containing protein/tetratricopeptide (TPR) repeat protein